MVFCRLKDIRGFWLRQKDDREASEKHEIRGSLYCADGETVRAGRSDGEGDRERKQIRGSWLRQNDNAWDCDGSKLR